MSSQSKPLLLVRPPSSLLSQGQLTHLSPSTTPPTHKTSLQQWKAYCDVYRRNGWEVVEIEEAEECPDGVFLEDSIVVFPSLSHKGGEAERGVVFLPRSGSIERRKEYPSAKAAVEKHLLPRGYTIIDFYQEDETGKATSDGGDILKVAKEGVVYIGRSSRTNEEGFELMRKVLEGRGWKVVGVEVGHHLHLKSAITALPDGQIIGNFLPRSGPSSAPSPGVTVPNKEILAIQEEHGIAVVDLDLQGDASKTNTVLLSSDAPGTKEQLEKAGWKVETVAVGDFEAMEGCVTCLSVRVRN